MAEKVQYKNIRTDKIKGFLKKRNLYYKDVAEQLKVNEKSMTNKMLKGNITAAELITIADTADTFIAFIDQKTGDVIEKLTTEDIKKE